MDEFLLKNAWKICLCNEALNELLLFTFFITSAKFLYGARNTDGWYLADVRTVPTREYMFGTKVASSKELLMIRRYAMKIGFTGAGKVGFNLGKYFSEKGVQVTGYYSRHQESAKEAADFTNTKCYDTLEELVNESDAIFLTVPDSAISSVYEEISSFSISGKQIIHCSGAMTAANAFPGIADTGAAGFAIHPLFPFSDKYSAYKDLAGVFFCLEKRPSNCCQ